MHEHIHSPRKAAFWLQIGAFLMFIAVALGAFGAHGLERMVEPKQLEVWQKGVTYMVIHSLALLWVAVLFYLFSSLEKSWCGIAWSFLLGILLFSGSLFLWVLTQTYWLVFLTPMGGGLFLVGWFWVLLTARKIART